MLRDGLGWHRIATNGLGRLGRMAATANMVGSLKRLYNKGVGCDLVDLSHGIL
jgi:hypothetical protein